MWWKDTPGHRLDVKPMMPLDDVDDVSGDTA
jgi:hypothetical protein